MKKKIFIGMGVFLIIVIVLGGFSFLMNTFVFKDKAPENTSKTEQTTEQKTTVSSDMTDYKSATQERENAIKPEVKQLLSDFGKKWVNYETIYKRNQSVKDYFSNEAIKEHGLEVDPHADFEGEGEITNIYQSLDDSNSYVLVGEERARSLVNEIVLEVKIDTNELKITNLTVNYMRQAY